MLSVVCSAPLNGSFFVIKRRHPIPVVITAYKDKTFKFVTKLPAVSHFLKKAAKIDKGSSTPGRELVGRVTIKDIEKIA